MYKYTKVKQVNAETFKKHLSNCPQGFKLKSCESFSLWLHTATNYWFEDEIGNPSSCIGFIAYITKYNDTGDISYTEVKYYVPCTGFEADESGYERS